MTDTTHTPGPWGIRQIKHISDNALLITASNDEGITYGGHIVTELCDPARFQKCKNFRPETQIANARLIAAAPELLEALKAMDDAFSHYCEYCQQSDDETAALVKARATIAKAEAS